MRVRAEGARGLRGGRKVRRKPPSPSPSLKGVPEGVAELLGAEFWRGGSTPPVTSGKEKRVSVHVQSAVCAQRLLPYTQVMREETADLAFLPLSVLSLALGGFAVIPFCQPPFHLNSLIL